MCEKVADQIMYQNGVLFVMPIIIALAWFLLYSKNQTYGAISEILKNKKYQGP